jgi:hypothetical protein
MLQEIKRLFAELSGGGKQAMRQAIAIMILGSRLR